MSYKITLEEGKARFECIKWKIGFRNLWNRISYDEFEKDRKSVK